MKRTPRDTRRLTALAHELAREGHPHPSPEAIARLMEQDETVNADPEATEHIVRCRRCYALYAEMVHAEIDQRTEDDGLELLDEDLVARALEIAAPRSDERAMLPAPIFGWRRGLVLACTIAGLLLLASAPWRQREGSVPPELATPVMEALVFALPPGWVLDGRIPEPPQEIYRDGNGATDLGPVIEQLVHRYRSERHNIALVELLVLACMADDKHESADAFLRRARSDFPKEPRMALLHAAFLARANRLAEAEKILLDWSEKSSNPTPFLVDLALLRQAEQDRSAALTILRRLEDGGKRAAPSAKHLRKALQVD